ncbi:MULTISPECIES: RloB family protein [Mediterranea]|uniref:RloB family protein n=1 Tax=Mediterranea TaxID=1926659 RepID=UPI002011433D|nr:MULTISPECIES: RloB family protein [Mediterranea]MCL1606864.1 RloB family protein [Mediterranea sp. ET5]MDM8123598.1 RloB family protein [Mediterranea massiliensis]MDM8197846.1 RloB family protein [Mediterranea massiliensis]
MGRLRQTALILGEGPTEFFYFKSLCDIFKSVTIKPDYPKHTSMKELEAKIADGVAMGYNHIFCIVDMDTRDVEPERSQYQKLKMKYAKPVAKPKKGIYCKVEFFETHRCTELFFLYYFRYTSRLYETQEPLLKDLNQCIAYQKTADFFIKTKGLHGYFERNGGSLEKAVANANRSMEEKQKSARDYTYSELGRLIIALNNLSK